MTTASNECTAALLIDRIATGDTMAVIEGQELLDRICDDCDRGWDGDPLEVDYTSTTEGRLGLLACVLGVLYGTSYGPPEADTVALLYRIHGGRQVRYGQRRVVVWHRDAEPLWDDLNPGRG